MASNGVAATADWVGVDWGTSNLRAWGISASGSVVFTQTSDQGMSRLAPGEFSGALSDLLATPLGGRDGPIDVVICGMAGARQGWLEAPYIEVPSALSGFANGVVRPEARDKRLNIVIVPGLCVRAPNLESVMRGEETKLVGFCAKRPDYRGTLYMAGTHGKWVSISHGTVTGFQTSMTGELYEVLRTHSVLKHSVGDGQVGPRTEEGIAAGMNLGLAEPERLSSHLFKVRATSLLSDVGADWCDGFLSGLLIGAEIGGQRKLLEANKVILMGADRLVRLYQAGFSRAGIGVEVADATEATLGGLGAIREQLQHG